MRNYDLEFLKKFSLVIGFLMLVTLGLIIGAYYVHLQLPAEVPGFTVLQERFVARDYSKLEERDEDGREVQWAIRRALGEQDLYYRAVVVRADANHQVALDFEPTIGEPPVLEEPFSTAAQTLLDEVRKGSSNTVTFGWLCPCASIHRHWPSKTGGVTGAMAWIGGWSPKMVYWAALMRSAFGSHQRITSLAFWYMLHFSASCQKG